MKQATLLLSIDNNQINEFIRMNNGTIVSSSNMLENVNLFEEPNLIVTNLPISREKRIRIYTLLKSHNYYVSSLLLHAPLNVILKDTLNAEERIFNYKFMGPPRIGVDCDEITVGNNYHFLKPNTNLDDVLMYSKKYGILKTIKAYIHADYREELKNIACEHETPYHLESIHEHIDMCIINSNTQTLQTTALLHDLGKTVCKNVGSYKGHDKLSSLYAMMFFNDVEKSTLNNFDIIEIINQHMQAHKGISEKVIQESKLNSYILNQIELFKQIDEKSRRTGK
ncbi:hypothetical protein [Acholeplasma hippikon]|uniref:HD domain-containing protein n=1 Tax=Acholeplasma hippikon TaxID=264636 RepID=A0A449BKQ9_9MOLU|nr:hypothetical protein [Acholeplasma hippikon]VEU83012.1 Uncharacterised protein [Acholeplasma hippikon]